MRVIGGILAVIVFVGSTLDVASACFGEAASSSSEVTVFADYNAPTELPHDSTSHDCPISCHSNGGHCHNTCFKQINSQTPTFAIKLAQKLTIDGDFRAPSAPFIEVPIRPPLA